MTQILIGSPAHIAARNLLKMIATHRAHLELEADCAVWVDKQIARLMFWGDEVMLSEKEAAAFGRIIRAFEPVIFAAANDNALPQVATGA